MIKKRKPPRETCEKCGGDGRRWIKCENCQGAGCRTCVDMGNISITCVNCVGRGEV